MDEIRFVAGPIVGRYQDKIEEERQAVQKAEDERLAKKRAEIEARKKAEEEARAAKEKKEGKAEAKTNGSGASKDEDAEMKDAETVKADGVEEPEEGGAKK